jgi:hypothetical protein
MNTLSLSAAARLLPAEEPKFRELLPPAVKRRDPRIWQMAFEAARRAIERSPASPRSIVTATALGALDETCRFLDGIFKDNLGSPRNFVASVHNSMAGRLAMLFKISGPNLTICDGQNSLASAIAVCAAFDADSLPALVVAVDEHTELLARLLPHVSAECRAYLHPGWVDGAVAFVVDRPQAGGAYQVAALGPAPLAPDQKPRTAVDALCSRAGLDPAHCMQPRHSSISFLRPAIVVQQRLEASNADPLPLIVPSYSPAARAAALVYLCD